MKEVKDEFPASPMGAREGCACLGCEIMRKLDAERDAKKKQAELESLAIAPPDTP